MPLIELFKGRVTLIPKKRVPESMSDWRPITVFPIVIRLINKILVRRLKEVSHFEFQSGFMEERSTSENIFLLKEILKVRPSEGRA